MKKILLCALLAMSVGCAIGAEKKKRLKKRTPDLLVEKLLQLPIEVANEALRFTTIDKLTHMSDKLKDSKKPYSKRLGLLVDAYIMRLYVAKERRLVDKGLKKNRLICY